MFWKKITLGAVVLCFMSGFGQVAGAETVSLNLLDLGAKENFDLQGHRGARGLAPENTLAGFSKALEFGVTTLELDTGVTKDGVVVIHHDAYLNPNITRDSGGKWVEDKFLVLMTMNYDQIAQFNVGKLRPGTKYAERFSRQQSEEFQVIPKLADLFELVKKSDNETVRFNIETKINPELPRATVGPDDFAKALLTVIEQYNMQDRVSIQSFDWRTLQIVQKEASDIPTVYLTAQQKWLDNIAMGQDGTSGWTADFDIDDYEGSVPKMVKSAGGSVWSPFYRELTSELLNEAHEQGLKVIPWTVNNREDFALLVKMGVDGIITDYPNLQFP
ncbi:glycerophosphodiester phosphodiesterase [Kiloniella sp. EL199]|uniref:glycerophosphodiester phosphodiesterase n=1 Tax=Kiloniella sp. EL199 TaxID=2107581 RepID=UPI000EA05552|nr:glycerophosphodiester phosphodiesterase [Kiloniella sp. EL199]